MKVSSNILMEHGPYKGLEICFYVSEEDGAPVVQIDTPADSDFHDKIRVYLNDALATHWSLMG